MKKFLSILLTILAIAIATPATRADELSELVAAVAASMDTTLMARDIKTTTFQSRYVRKAKAVDNEISSSDIDGILTSMNRISLQDSTSFDIDGILTSMNRIILQDRRIDDDDYEDLYESHHFRPTLGRADFYRPVAGIITSRFGWRPQFQRMHHGVDLSLNVGDTVRAAVSGTVNLISYDHNGYGNYVVMTHPDGMETVYGHLQYALVSQGQFVYAGQPLAIGGNTGKSTGPHLHFETRLGGVAIDPTLIFDFYSSRNWFYAQSDALHNGNSIPKGPSYSHQSKSLKKEHTYVVRYGDTLESVARQAGISVMRLCQLNMLSDSSPLPVGRMIKLK